MVFTANPDTVFTADIKAVCQHRITAECSSMKINSLLSNFKQTDTLNITCCIGKILINKFLSQPHCFKHLGPGI